MAAVCGGTQSLHTNSLDEALALPTDKSVRIALRTQQIVAYESGITNVVDPLAGSYAIEALTKEIEEGALAYIKEIDDLGGMMTAIEKGYDYQKSIESGDRIIVGVNKFHIDEDMTERKLLKVDASVGENQIKKLREMKEKRDNVRVKTTLDAVREGAKGDANLMPLILDAVHAYATEGEICGVLREVFGEYKENVVL